MTNTATSTIDGIPVVISYTYHDEEQPIYWGRCEHDGNPAYFEYHSVMMGDVDLPDFLIDVHIDEIEAICEADQLNWS